MADFLLIGGDARQRYLAHLLRREGHRVRTWGVAADPQDMVDETRAIVCLPIPSFRSGKIPGEFGTALETGKALDRITGRPCIFYGNVKEEALIASHAPSALVNLARDEVFLQENAELTAEGAIRAVSSDKGCALWHSRCLILGYGRIGAALLQRLSAMGASVSVAARRHEAREAAQKAGATVCDFSTLPWGADFIFNTVPAAVLPPHNLACVTGDALYVELASAPYGISEADADRLGMRSLYLPGVPGKFFPKTSAVCIRDAYFRSNLPEILL